MVKLSMCLIKNCGVGGTDVQLHAFLVLALYNFFKSLSKNQSEECSAIGWRYVGWSRYSHVSQQVRVTSHGKITSAAKCLIFSTLLNFPS